MLSLGESTLGSHWLSVGALGMMQTIASPSLAAEGTAAVARLQASLLYRADESLLPQRRPVREAVSPTLRISGPARDALISKPARPPAPLHAIVICLLQAREQPGYG